MTTLHGMINQFQQLTTPKGMEDGSQQLGMLQEIMNDGIINQSLQLTTPEGIKDPAQELTILQEIEN